MATGINPVTPYSGVSSGSSTDQTNQAALQTTNQGQITQQNQAGSQQQAQQNTYSPGAAGSQAGAQSLLQSILAGGQPPPNMGLTQAAWDAANNNFQLTTAHQLAAQYGAGSATIPEAEMQMQENLAAQSSQDAWNNLNNVFSDVANVAYNPTGVTSSGSQQQSQTGATNTDTTQRQAQQTNDQGSYNSKNASVDLGGILSGLFSGSGTFSIP